MDDEDEIAALMKKMATAPETRGEFVKIVKKHRPDLQFPDVDAQEQVAEMRRMLDEHKAEALHQEQRRALEAERSKIANTYGEDFTKKLETKVMPELGIMSYKAAAEYQAAIESSQNQRRDIPERPTAMWEMPVDMKGIMSNSKAYSRDQAYATIAELRRGK